MKWEWEREQSIGWFIWMICGPQYFECPVKLSSVYTCLGYDINETTIFPYKPLQHCNLSIQQIFVASVECQRHTIGNWLEYSLEYIPCSHWLQIDFSFFFTGLGRPFALHTDNNTTPCLTKKKTYWFNIFYALRMMHSEAIS